MPAAFVAVNCAVPFTHATGTTATGTTTRDIAAGEHVVVAAFGHNSAIGAVSSITVGSLTLTKDAGIAQQPEVEIWSAHASSLIATGATVTITWAVSTANPRGGICLSLSGVATTSYVRGTPQTDHNSTANPSITSDANPASGDIAISGVVINDNTSTLPTAGTGYTIPASGSETESFSGTVAAVEYSALGTSGATTAGFTHVADVWSQTLVVYAGAATAPTVTHTWQRDGVDIPGATGTNYTLVQADVGHTITVHEIATNSNGSSSADSNSIGLIGDLIQRTCSGGFEMCANAVSNIVTNNVYADAAAVVGQAVISAVENSIFVEAAAVIGRAVISAVETSSAALKSRGRRGWSRSKRKHRTWWY